jgi:CHRD domain-containing protein
MHRAIRMGSLVASAALAFACDSSTDTKVSYAASLSGANEVPAVTSSGTGTFTATLDENNVLTYNLTFTGLTSNSILAHIHGPASTTVSSGVLVDFNNAAAGRIITFGSPSGTGSGTIDLKLAINANVSGDSLRKLLDLGLTYVNVHTTVNQGGEIRGQVIKQ